MHIGAFAWVQGRSGEGGKKGGGVDACMGPEPPSPFSIPNIKTATFFPPPLHPSAHPTLNPMSYSPSPFGIPNPDPYPLPHLLASA